MLEFWWPIRFAPGYEVNEAGIVRRALPGRKTYPGKVISPTKHHFGYPRIKLTIDRKHKTFELHTLMLLVFAGPKPFPKAEARHLDGNPANNHISNLAWSTHRKNEADKRLHGTSSIGARNGAAKLTEADIRDIRHDYAEVKSLTKIGAKYGISFQHVSDIVNRKSWAHVR